MKSFLTKHPLVAQVGSVVVATLFVASLVEAASTISTNIATGGTLTVAGQAALGNASSTLLSAQFLQVGGTATTTFNSQGSILQPTTNTATTTLIAGCIQTYATSTATAIRIEFGVNNMASTTFRTGAPSGIGGGGQVVWIYGTCP